MADEIITIPFTASAIGLGGAGRTAGVEVNVPAGGSVTGVVIVVRGECVAQSIQLDIAIPGWP